MHIRTTYIHTSVVCYYFGRVSSKWELPFLELWRKEGSRKAAFKLMNLSRFGHDTLVSLFRLPFFQWNNLFCIIFSGTAKWWSWQIRIRTVLTSKAYWSTSSTTTGPSCWGCPSLKSSSRPLSKSRRVTEPTPSIRSQSSRSGKTTRKTGILGKSNTTKVMHKVEVVFHTMRIVKIL